jgi:hypothetical protein
MEHLNDCNEFVTTMTPNENYYCRAGESGLNAGGTFMNTFRGDQRITSLLVSLCHDSDDTSIGGSVLRQIF